MGEFVRDETGAIVPVVSPPADPPSNKTPRPNWAATLNLANRRELAYRQIDEAAGRARSRYITAAPGQEAVYQLKADEAAAYVAAGYPTGGTTADDYPLLHAEATATGSTMAGIADMVLALRAAWVQIAATIEGLRMGGKRDVELADDIPEVEGLVSTTITALDAV
jgi:hypothetical protein